jgi:hypothetical protein
MYESWRCHRPVATELVEVLGGEPGLTGAIERRTGKSKKAGSIGVISSSLPSSRIMSSSINQDLDAGGSTAWASRICVVAILSALSFLKGRNKAGCPNDLVRERWFTQGIISPVRGCGSVKNEREYAFSCFVEGLFKVSELVVALNASSVAGMEGVT